jgi:hypothetical protein
MFKNKCFIPGRKKKKVTGKKREEEESREDYSALYGCRMGGFDPPIPEQMTNGVYGPQMLIRTHDGWVKTGPSLFDEVVRHLFHGLI